VRTQRAEGEAGGDTTAQRVALAGLALGVIVASVLAALWLGRALARPLERRVGAASRLGRGDYSARAPAPAIPEVDAVGDALATTARRLEALVNRERAFSADASHQLRTPLQALRLELEAAELRGDASPELQAALVQVDRLQDTMTTLLAVARDHPRREVATDVGAVLDAVGSRWHGPLAAASRPLRIEGPGTTRRAAADPRVVEQIMEVLLDNAARHGAGVVGVAVRDLDDWLAIDVTDEGTGFGAEPEAAFTRRTTGSDGQGIGLSLARSLADAEGGRLSVTRTGPGPVVTLMLRVA
jgi:signal transduction histidine kinase